MHKNQNQQRFKFKKKVKISSLEAAICNVALFKSMKDKQFKDTIFISYCQQGVILQSTNQNQWNRASQYIASFLTNKKIALLTFGYDRQQYQSLISKGLKDITRRIKQRDEQCPYINIIHYQKLRKSCEYMDKQRYLEPLKFWEIKNKSNPNFAFLIVEPRRKFDQVKKGLLEFLTGQIIQLTYMLVDPVYFVYLFGCSSLKEKIKEAHQHKLIDISMAEDTYEQMIYANNIQEGNAVVIENSYMVQIHGVSTTTTNGNNSNNSNKITSSPNILTSFNNGNTPRIKLTNFSSVNLSQYSYSLLKTNKNLLKSGLYILPQQQLKQQSRNCKHYLRQNLPQLLEQHLQRQQQKLSIKKQQEISYVIVPYKLQQKDKYVNILDKYVNTGLLSKKQIYRRLQTGVVCGYPQIQWISDITSINSGDISYSHIVRKVCINSAPFLAIEYNVGQLDLDSFIVYLDQLRLYYCTYMVRFYGIAIKYIMPSANNINSSNNINSNTNINNSNSKTIKNQPQKITLIFDYHPFNTLQQMLQNDLIFDNMQVGTIILQLLYYISYLHEHQQPRCLGPISLDQIYWPMGVILPFLGEPCIVNNNNNTTTTNNNNSNNNNNKYYSYGDNNNNMLNNNNYGNYSIQNDIKQVGSIMKVLLYGKQQGQPNSNINNSNNNRYNNNNSGNNNIQQIQKDQDYTQLIDNMMKISKQQRWNIKKCIAELQQILSI